MPLPSDEERLEDADRFRVLFEHASDAQFVLQDDVIIDCNPAMVALIGAGSKSEVLRVHPRQLSPATQPDGSDSEGRSREYDAKAFAEGYCRFEWVHRKLDGEDFPVQVTLNAVRIGGRPALIAVWHDLTDFRRREAALQSLNEQLATAYRALDAEMQAVGRIQRSLLPLELPAISTLELSADYQTSTLAGGDYYDVFQLPGNAWGLLIADVSGHGTPAAVVMAITHALAHAYSGPTGPPGRLLSHLNEALARRYASDGGFVTAFYGVYDAERRVLRYASAGHPPPRLARPTAAGMEVLSLEEVGGLPLGIVDDGPGYDAAEIGLKAGDVLALYTDGVTETRNPAGELLGVERLDERLRRCGRDAGPREIVAALKSALAAYSGGAPPADDVTLLIARVT